MRMFNGNQAFLAFLRAMLSVNFGHTQRLAPAYVSQRGRHADCNAAHTLKVKAKQRRHGLYRRHVFPKD